MCQLCAAPFAGLAMDRKTPRASAFARAKQTEATYARQLRKIARHIDDVTRTIYNPDDPLSAPALADLLRRYSETIGLWAAAEGARMVAEVNARDLKAWNAASRKIGTALRFEIDSTPVGAVMRSRLNEQVSLIKSIPLEAAERVHKLTLEGITQSRRASEIAKEIAASGEVSKSRANLIARTEVSRTATELTAARAQYVGSTHFIWRTAGDSDVRPTHKALNGKTFRWDSPPECDPGYHALPGGIFNCRCWPEPLIED